MSFVDCPVCADHAQNALLDGSLSPSRSMSTTAQKVKEAQAQSQQITDLRTNSKRRNLLPASWSMLWPSRNSKPTEVNLETVGLQIEAYKALWQQYEGQLPSTTTEKTVEQHFNCLPAS